jgi:hypothetical protein
MSSGVAAAALDVLDAAAGLAGVICLFSTVEIRRHQ